MTRQAKPPRLAACPRATAMRASALALALLAHPAAGEEPAGVAAAAGRLWELLEREELRSGVRAEGLERRRQALVALEAATTDTLAAAFADWREHRFIAARGLLAERWLEVDEAAALRSVRSLAAEAEAHDLIEEFEAQWSWRHPESLLEWLRRAGPDESRNRDPAPERRDFAAGPVPWQCVVRAGEGWLLRERATAVKRLDALAAWPDWQGAAFQGMAGAATTAEECKALLDWLASPVAGSVRFGYGKYWNFNVRNFFEDCGWRDLAMLREWFDARRGGLANPWLEEQRADLARVLEQLGGLEERLRAAGSNWAEARDLRDRVVRRHYHYGISLRAAGRDLADSEWVAGLTAERAKHLLPLCRHIDYWGATGFAADCLAIVRRAEPDGVLPWLRSVRRRWDRRVGIERLWDDGGMHDLVVLELTDLAQRDPGAALAAARRECGQAGLLRGIDDLGPEIPIQGFTGVQGARITETVGRTWLRQLGLRESLQRVIELRPPLWRAAALEGWGNGLARDPPAAARADDFLWCLERMEHVVAVAQETVGRRRDDEDEDAKACEEADLGWSWLGCRSDLLDRAAALDLPAAVRWLEAKPGRLSDLDGEWDPLVRPVLDRWANTDYAAAMDWYLAAVPRALREKALKYALHETSGWGRLDLWFWLPTMVDDPAWPAVCETIAWWQRSDDPVGAAEWIKGGEPERRVEEVASIVWHWGKLDSAAAGAFLDELEPEGPRRERIERELGKLRKEGGR